MFAGLRYHGGYYSMFTKYFDIRRKSWPSAELFAKRQRDSVWDGELGM